MSEIISNGFRYLGLGSALLIVLLGFLAYLVYTFGIKSFLSPLRKIPGPEYNPIFGNVKEAIMGEAMQSSFRLTQKYGSIVHFYHLFGRDRVLVADPEALKYILITNPKSFRREFTPLDPKFLSSGILLATGEEHRFQRRIMNPHFSVGAIRDYEREFDCHGKQLAKRWRSQYKVGEGTVVEVQSDIFRMGLDSVGMTIFGKELNALACPDDDLVQALLTMSELESPSFREQTPIIRLLPSNTNIKFWKKMSLVDKAIYDMINQKRSAMKAQNANQDISSDVLGKLLLARDEETGQTLTDKEIRDQVVSLISAGHESTSSTISMVLLFLAQNPDIQQRLREEVRTILPEGSESVSLEQSITLDLLERCIKETQRLYPAAPSVTRICEKDVELNGYFIPSGTYLILHFGAMMRNPKYYPDPEKFDPERFIGADPEMCAFLPFSAGAHKCLGHLFAKGEMRVVLPRLIRNFHFAPVPGLSFKRKLRFGIMRMVPPIKLCVTPIQD